VTEGSPSRAGSLPREGEHVPASAPFPGHESPARDCEICFHGRWLRDGLFHRAVSLTRPSSSIWNPAPLIDHAMGHELLDQVEDLLGAVDGRCSTCVALAALGLVMGSGAAVTLSSTPSWPYWPQTSSCASWRRSAPIACRRASASSALHTTGTPRISRETCASANASLRRPRTGANEIPLRVAGSMELRERLSAPIGEGAVDGGGRRETEVR
jgi:hypothetical protein